MKLKHSDRAAKTVQKLDSTGELIAEYPSATAAARDNRLSYRYLLGCMQQGRNCHGIRFEYCVKPEFKVPNKEPQIGFQMRHNPYEIYREKTAIAK